MKRDPAAHPKVWVLCRTLRAAESHRSLLRYAGQFSRHVAWPEWISSTPGARDSRTSEILARAKSVCVSAEMLDPRGQFELHSLHIGAGCALLRSKSLLDSEKEPPVLAVVSCPSWYWGRCSTLTVLMPPEAAAIARQLKDAEGRPLGPVAPDCMLKVGSKENRPQAQARLLEVTAALQSPDRLAAAARALAGIGSAAASSGQTDAALTPMEHFRGARSKAKRELRTRGLCMRHLGRVHAVAGGDGLPPSVLWPCILPSRHSPSGQALYSCIEAAASAVGCGVDGGIGSSSATLRGGVVEAAEAAVCVSIARAFAARGVCVPADAYAAEQTSAWMQFEIRMPSDHEVVGSAAALRGGLSQREADEREVLIGATRRAPFPRCCGNSGTCSTLVVQAR